MNDGIERNRRGGEGKDSLDTITVEEEADLTGMGALSFAVCCGGRWNGGGGSH